MLPIGFQSDYKSNIGKTILEIDQIVESSCGFDADKPSLVALDVALKLLSKTESMLPFEDDDALPFDWEACQAALQHLSQQHPIPSEQGKVYRTVAR